MELISPCLALNWNQDWDVATASNFGAYILNCEVKANPIFGHLQPKAYQLH